MSREDGVSGPGSAVGGSREKLLRRLQDSRLTTHDFPDHFSAHAADYARFRPHYPDTLFDWIAAESPSHAVVWDCACGNGQATLPLASRFQHVVATDASAEQIAAAMPHARVEYRVAPAEASGIAPQSVDAVTVGQALHWLRLEEFWDEVRRVVRPGGLMAAWSYGVARLGDSELDRALLDLHDNIVGAYWPIERGHVNTGYQAIEMPFTPIVPPPIAMTVDWTLPQFAGYLRTWSAVRRYIAAEASDPVSSWEARVASWWGPGVRTVSWPLTVIAGRV